MTIQEKVNKVWGGANLVQYGDGTHHFSYHVDSCGNLDYTKWVYEELQDLLNQEGLYLADPVLSCDYIEGIVLETQKPR